jgi:hypothetical protein
MLIVRAYIQATFNKKEKKRQNPANIRIERERKKFVKRKRQTPFKLDIKRKIEDRQTQAKPRLG